MITAIIIGSLVVLGIWSVVIIKKITTPNKMDFSDKIYQSKN